MNIPYNIYKVGLEYPDLVIKIMIYFSLKYTDENGTIVPSNKKSITDFLDRHCKAETGGYFLNGFDVVKICDILFQKKLLLKVKSDGGLGLFNSYICNVSKLENTPMFINMFNSIVYGFEYIYERSKDMVAPVVWDKGNEEYAAGTAFKYLNGIVTAKHCITDVNNMMIKGFTADELRNSHVYVHQNDGVDIAFIEIGSSMNIDIFPEDDKVLDEVLVMGYPKIPAFTDMITAEKTSIAAKAEVRHTTTTGSIVSFGTQYLMKCEMMLITAKVSGGNSGGPVINDKGSLVGITSCLTDGEGNYDNLGYGVVSPVKYLMDIVSSNEKRKEMDVAKDFFRDWIW